MRRKKWKCYKKLQDLSLEAILSGTKIHGYKAVEGRSVRVWTNQDEALETLLSNGVERAVIYDSVPKTLAQLEKVLGTKRFTELVGKYVTKPQGKPALAAADDKRTEFNSAVADFAGVAKEKNSAEQN